LDILADIRMGGASMLFVWILVRSQVVEDQIPDYIFVGGYVVANYQFLLAIFGNESVANLLARYSSARCDCADKYN